MPYAIAVLLLVLFGTGYTLIQKAEVLPETLPTPTELITSSTSSVMNTENSDDDTDETEDDKTELREPEVKPDDNPSPSDINVQTTAPAAPKPPTTPVVVSSNTYTNGTYRTQNSYRTPDGTYQMSVSVTISDDTVSATTLSFDANGARDGYSKRFASSYQSQIIGKDFESVSLSRVGGASLTTKAFNSALNTIRSQAS